MIRRRLLALALAVNFIPEDVRADTSVPEPEPTEDAAEPKTIVERIDVRGLKKTKLSVVRDRLLVKAGEALDEDRVVVSKLRLMGLGFFRDVRTHIERGSKPGNVVVVFDMVERNSIVVTDIMLGVSRRTPFWAGLGIEETNFLGRGWKLGGAAVAGEGQQAVRLRFFDPAFLSNRLVLGGSLYFNKGREFFPDSFGALPDLNYQRLGGVATGGFNLGGFHHIYLDYRLESVMARIPAGVVADIDPDLTWLSSFSFTYERDSRNDNFIPTEGSRVSFGVEVGSRLLGSRYEFSKYVLKSEFLLPLVPEHAFKIELFAGLTQGYTPFFNQFYFGDHVYFSPRERSISRALGLNYSDASRYSQVAMSLSIEYDLPLFLRGRNVYRGYLFWAASATYMNRLTETLISAPSRAGDSPFTASFDIGIKLDTPLGNFVFSTAFILDFLL
ncbi:MAG: BamA/TamA family outer membrane protein [Deltaproteobacteria bacterium]|nr:BamA/TamA family outer membrane protein [Deltaproteobacteria bacterium]